MLVSLWNVSVFNQPCWCKIIETSKKFKTCTKVSKLCSHYFFPFSTINFNERCSSLKTYLNTSIVAFFGHEIKPSSIKRLNISSVNLYSLNVKCKGNRCGNKVVSSNNQH